MKDVNSRFKEVCEEFGGEMKNKVCVVDGYPMGKTPEVFDFKPSSQEHEVWNPDRFLRLTGWKQRKESPKWPWLPKRPVFDEEKVEFLMNRIREEKPLDVPFIDKDVEQGFKPKERANTVFTPNHEGRHRALACKKSEKCEKIPVVVYNKKQGHFVTPEEEKSEEG